MSLKLNNYSFDEWIEFVFNHPVPSENADVWYWKDEWRWEADAEHIIKYCIKLFRNPNFLLEKFSPEQINKGFWFILGDVELLQGCLWDRKIDWKLREDCIMSMVGVFEQMFIQNPIEDACYMWWDLLRNFSGNQDAKTKEAMLGALSQTLKLDSVDCQVSALHGLGHLEHNGKKKIIEQFLKADPNLDDKMKGYAIFAMEGKVL